MEITPILSGMFTNGVFVNSKNHVVKLYICATHDIEAKTIAGIANGYISKRTVMLATLFLRVVFVYESLCQFKRTEFR